ncbi:hypothetical protein GGR55DRAFT_301040 [Xylaria sp. FL0064]|nr:hypothetical protein GGR55DRAFT_301040 [Xylaria sp. FL0064]
MPLLDFSVKRLCLWSLIWGGIPAQAMTQLLVIGTPSVPTLTSTITLTTTVTYKPSLIPGNPQYTLVGCYSPISGDREQIFGPDDYNALLDDKVTPGNLTTDNCLRGCGSAKPAQNGNEGYVYAGLRNGSEFRCSNQLSPDAHKLTADDCKAPCSGDPRLSCGGRENVAVYSLISANSTSASSTPTDSETTTFSTVNPPEATNTATQAAAASHQDPSHSGAHGKSVSRPTIAVVTGSLSGAILVAGVLFLCYRARMRKKQIQDEHVRLMLERRNRPSISRPMFTETDFHSDVSKFTITRYDNNHGGTDSGGGGGGDRSWENKKHDEEPRLTSDGDHLPNMSALGSSGKFPVGLHPRTNFSFASNTRSTTESEDGDIWPSVGKVRSQSGIQPIHVQAASSAVQWREDAASPTPPNTPHKRTKSSTNIATPLPAARNEGLGDRAWHRRKLSTPYAPPPGAAGRNIIARNDPPSGPPETSLPPMPPVVQGRPQSRPRAGTPPPPPRRSFERVDLEPKPGGRDASKPEGAGLGIPLGSGKEKKALGMSLANKSTPALGRYASLWRSNQPSLESPTLGWQTSTGRGQSGSLSREGDPADKLPKVPALPPVAPGERFDHKRWRGTLYAAPDEGDRTRRRSRGSDMSPLSASSTGTSILFGPDEFDRQL